MRNILHVEADIKGQRRVPAYTVTQNDSVSIIVTVLDGGSPVNLDEVSTMTIACTRRDGLVVVKDGTQTGPYEVTFDLGTTEIEQTGKVDAVIQLYSADGRVSTIKFSFMVTKDPTGEGYVPSEDERTLIEVVLGDGPLTIERAETAAANAESAAEYIDEKKPLIDKFTDEQTNLQAQLDEVARGATNVETSQARVSTTGTAYGTLKQRLDTEYEEVTSQLAQKANQSDVRLNTVKLGQADITDELLQQITGNAPINAVPARDSITRSRFAKSAVTPDVLAFTEKPNNLFNKFDVLRGYSITSGNLVANADYAASEFIYIKGNHPYVSANIFRTTFYDESQNFISSTTAASFTSPANAFFVRFTVVITQIENAQVNEGTTLLAYDEPKFVLKSSNKYPIDIVPSVKSVKSEAIDLKAVEPPSMAIFEPSRNIFNSSHVLIDKIINSTGDIVDNTSYVTSADFIPVKKGATYSKSTGAGLIVARYDANKNLINRSSFSADVATFTTTTATEFIRVSVTKIAQDTMMINEGDTLLPFEPYQFVMKSSEKFPIKLDNELAPSGGGGGTNPDKTSKNKDYFILEPSFNNVYTSPVLESKASGTSGHLESVTLNDIYGLYDQLLAQYPSYISKELLGNDDNGNPIYKYEFKPELPAPSAGDPITSTKFIKMVITAGVHGVEKTGVWLTYLAMKNTCENWKNDALLEALRWNVHFVVIPVVCPWSYVNRTRTNHNGVDINRNFPSEWREGTVGSETYGGPAPLSEKESQYVNAVLNANLDAVYVCDFHNYFDTNGEPKNFVWMAASSRYDMGLGRYLISKMSRKWQKEQSFLENNTELYGYTSFSPPGSVATQALSLGIDSTTFEVCRQFELEPDFVPYSSIALTLGNEAFVNYLAVVLRNIKTR